MDNQRAKELLERYTKGECDPEEQAWVESWYLQAEGAEVPVSHSELIAAMDQVRRRLPVSPVRRLWPRIAAAASVLLFLAAGSYFFFHDHATSKQNTAYQAHDIAPGGNKAILVLANGQQINLTGARNGKVAEQGNTTVSKTGNGELSYQTGSPAKNNAAVNTLITPRGGMYTLILPDGSRVTLNAASSLEYPAGFGGKERRVKLTGEGYFEIAHNPKIPFRVTTGKETTEVLGTHFNINAYRDEAAITTTLLAGSVKISNGKDINILKPGQQAYSRDDALVIRPADTTEIVAWKNGYFRFNDEKIESVMRKISRWYNVDVVYQGIIPREEFDGRISRFKRISQVLKVLESTKTVHFKVEGRRVTVMQ